MFHPPHPVTTQRTASPCPAAPARVTWRWQQGRAGCPQGDGLGAFPGTDTRGYRRFPRETALTADLRGIHARVPLLLARLRRAHRAPGLAVGGGTGSVPSASRAVAGADEESRWLLTGTERSGRVFPAMGSTAETAGYLGRPLCSSPVIRSHLRCVSAPGAIYASPAEPRHLPTPAQCPQVGAGSPAAPGPSPADGAANTHPRSCGAPTDRTGPDSAQLLSGLRRRAGQRRRPRRRGEEGQ